MIRHRNALPVPVVVHLHGGHTPPESDGYPTDLIQPTGPRQAAGSGAMSGAMFDDPQASVTTGYRTYTYPLQQRASTLWYHDHRNAYTGASIWRGSPASTSSATRRKTLYRCPAVSGNRR